MRCRRLVQCESRRDSPTLLSNAIQVLFAPDEHFVADNRRRRVDRFVEQEELLDMLQAADIYVTPYLNMDQVTSGTLSYAFAVGKPIIATPMKAGASAHVRSFTNGAVSAVNIAAWVSVSVIPGVSSATCICTSSK